ncbi:hypothetical protein QW180_16805 [Vibrio sinaloensis]|nr:hypothetical protein [Vibrio sinaloensis]
MSRVRSIQSANSEQLYDKPAFGTHIAPNYIWKMVELDRVTTPIFGDVRITQWRAAKRVVVSEPKKQLLTRWEG